MIQCIASCYSVMLHSDVTSKASSSAFNKLSFQVGVNMLGGHCMPWAMALIPAETESEHMYTEVYKAAHSANKCILTLRAVSPTSHAAVLLMPTQKFIRQLMDTLDTACEPTGEFTMRAAKFQRSFMVTTWTHAIQLRSTRSV